MVDLRRSLVINFFSSSGATVVQFVVSLVLARMLTPGEIGVFSITVLFVNIAHIFRDFGVSTYLQREPELTKEKIRSAVGVLYTSSWLIAILLYCVSGWVALWFKEPAIAPVMRVLAIGFAFIPFGSVTQALLAREFAADKQAYVTAVSTLGYAASCLILASLGFGTMSLAWANLVNIIISGIAYIPFRPKNTPWLPSFHHWRNICHFGIGTLVSNCINAINNALPDVLLGKLGSATHVGLFSRANSTVTIFSYVAGSTVNYGSLSYMSQAHHRGDALSPLLSRAVALLTGIGWPALALTCVLGDEIVMALYGAKWLDCVPAITGLAVAAAITMAFNYTPAALTALGRPYLSAVPIAVTVLTRIACGIALFDGGLRAFSWAICLATLAAAPVALYQQSRYLGFGLRQMLKAVLPSALVSLICALAAEALRHLIPSSYAALVSLLIMAIPLAIVWYMAVRITRHPILQEIHHFGNAAKKRLLFAFKAS